MMKESRAYFKEVIIAEVCRALMIEDINHKGRKKEVVEARALCYYFMRNRLNMGYQDIGNVFNKNHASVMHAIKQVPYMMIANIHLRSAHDKVDEILEKMAPKLSSRELRELNLMREVEKLREKNNELRKQLAELKEFHQC